eukprot:6190521-Pleurochrysis_carterae.AAC.1
MCQYPSALGVATPPAAPLRFREGSSVLPLCLQRVAALALAPDATARARRARRRRWRGSRRRARRSSAPLAAPPRRTGSR